jgi:uncharacterized protein DUF4160
MSYRATYNAACAILDSRLAKTYLLGYYAYTVSGGVVSRDGLLQRPPHVHVAGPDGRAKFELGATPNDVVLVESDGIRVASLRQIAAAIIDRHQECLENWEKYHGNQSTNRQGR